jgi:murein DD-endopeptidase MepM/ murein hydrolase activator NlpD
MANKKKNFTVIVVPEGTAQFRQVQIPYALVRSLIALVVVMFLLLPAGIYLFVRQYQALEHLTANLAKLRKDTKEQKALLAQYEPNLNELRQITSQLKLDNAKLMGIAGIDTVPEMPTDLSGLGGDGDVLKNMLASFREDSEDALLQKVQNLEQLKTYAVEQQVLSQRLMEFFQDQKILFASLPSIWPARCMLMSEFGSRKSPFTGQITMHYGIDIANSTGTPIIASADGIVSFSGVEGDFGKVLVIDHGYGYTTFYGHCSVLKKKVGDKVKRGDLIALVGSSGRTTGPHLHYEVRVNGVATNPLRYILN